MRIVGRHEDRRSGRAIGEQVQRGKRRQEQIWRMPVSQPERRLDRITLRPRQPIEVAKDRSQQLVQPGKGLQRLRLHARGPQHEHPPLCGALGGHSNERRLADTRPTGQPQRAATVVNVVEQLIQHAQLGLAPE